MQIFISGSYFREHNVRQQVLSPINQVLTLMAMFLSLPKPGMANWFHLSANLSPLFESAWSIMLKRVLRLSVHLERVPFKMSSKDKEERNDSRSAPGHFWLQQILLVLPAQNNFLLIGEPWFYLGETPLSTMPTLPPFHPLKRLKLYPGLINQLNPYVNPYVLWP